MAVCTILESRILRTFQPIQVFGLNIHLPDQQLPGRLQLAHNALLQRDAWAVLWGRNNSSQQTGRIHENILQEVLLLDILRQLHSDWLGSGTFHVRKS